LEKAQEQKELKKREAELEKVKQRLAEKEKDEELERMRQQLREKEEDLKNRAEKVEKKDDTSAITPEGMTEDNTVEEDDSEEEEIVDDRLPVREVEVRPEESDVDDEVVPQSSSSEWSEA
jgi:chaperone BCS1